MTGPLVTIVVTVHDGEAFLAEALQSAVSQTHRPIEVIVVDDGSTDGSAGIAEGFGPPVEVVRRPHRGISAARNVALERFAGSFLTLVDADDRMHPESVSRSLAAFAAHPSADAVFHAVSEFVSPGVDAALFADRDVGTVRPGRLPGNCLVRRDAVERVGHYDETMVRAEGADWTSRLVDLPAETVALDDVLSERRLHTANHGLRNPEAIRDYVGMARRHLHRTRAARPPEG